MTNNQEFAERLKAIVKEHGETKTEKLNAARKKMWKVAAELGCEEKLSEYALPNKTVREVIAYFEYDCDLIVNMPIGLIDDEQTGKIVIEISLKQWNLALGTIKNRIQEMTEIVKLLEHAVIIEEPESAKSEDK